jgi:hypothetical protein
MATQNAAAALSSTVEFVAITGFIDYKQGLLDPTTVTIKPISNSRWGSLTGTTWGEFTNYRTASFPIKWTGPLNDNGDVRYFTLKITAEFQGSISYIVTTSETGAFTGEEDLYVIEEGNTNIPVFYGRYFYVTAIVVGNELIRFSCEASNKVVEYRYSNVNTSTLGGTTAIRTFTLPRPFSGMAEIAIHPQAAAVYAVNLYVSATATSQALIPVIHSKNGTAPTFTLYGIDNDPRDGVVDITIKAYPRQAMAGGSVYVIE